MGSFDLLRHSSSVEPNEPGLLVDVTPESARWEFISFSVRRLCAGDRWEGSTGDRETCLVLLSGRFVVTWCSCLPPDRNKMHTLRSALKLQNRKCVRFQMQTAALTITYAGR